MAKKIMALLSFVEVGKGQKLMKEFNKNNIRIHFQTFGFGTAPTEMMDIFGLGTNDKDVVISLGAESDVQNLVANFGSRFQSHSKYGGLTIILDISAAGRLLTEIVNYGDTQNKEKEPRSMQNEHQNNLVVVSVNQGYIEDVMQVARKAGATGGTVLKGRLADMEQFSEFISTNVDEERELLCILAPAKASKQIMEDINREFGLTSPANGIIFALPTEKAFKI